MYSWRAKVLKRRQTRDTRSIKRSIDLAGDVNRISLMKTFVSFFVKIRPTRMKQCRDHALNTLMRLKRTIGWQRRRKRQLLADNWSIMFRYSLGVYILFGVGVFIIQRSVVFAAAIMTR